MAEGGRRLLFRAAGAAGATALIVLLLRMARPRAVWGLLQETSLRAVAWALLAYACMLGLRGLRLRRLLPEPRPGAARAWVIMAAARVAALFLPLRSGELVLPWLVRRYAGSSLAAGMAALLTARALDLASLGVWGVVSLLWVSRGSAGALGAAVLLVVPLLALPAVVEGLYRVFRRLVAVRGLEGRRLTRKIRRLRDALRTISARPVDLAAASVLSLVIWGIVWCLTWILLAGMGRPWPPSVTVAGSAAASIANLLPLNLVANVGTLEAGWTAAFTALGVPAEEAAATGFATHLWALLFAAVCGGLAWGLLALTCRRPSGPGGASPPGVR